LNDAQVKYFIIQFSVFSNQFLIAQLHKMLNADTIDEMRASKEGVSTFVRHTLSFFVYMAVKIIKQQPRHPMLWSIASGVSRFLGSISGRY